MERYRNVFFDELNSQRADDEDEDYNNTYKPLTGDDRYTLSPGSLHNTIQYENESQEPPYKDELEESPADKEQYLIEKNMMEDLLHNFNNLDIIVLRPAVVNTHHTKKAKRDLRHSEQITRPTTKATETAEASTIHTVIRIL